MGDPGKLANVPDERLVTEAMKVAERADFMDSNAWQALCQSDPSHALRGLEAEVASNTWEARAWRPFLWAANKIQDPDSVMRIAALLLSFPKEKLATSENTRTKRRLWRSLTSFTCFCNDGVDKPQK